MASSASRWLASVRCQVAGGKQVAQVAGLPVAGGRWQVAGGRWQVASSASRWLASGRWQVAGSRWQAAGSK
ncbi:MAG: hypothetical protein AB1791_08450 [Chloroflexota bacterium]